MKSVVVALLVALPLTAQASPPPPGMRGVPAPVREPMRRFVWHDEVEGYTFTGPARWAGVVQAVRLEGNRGIRFVAGQDTVLTIRYGDDTLAKAAEASGARELSRHDDRVLMAWQAPHAGALALSDEEWASAVHWDGDRSGEAVR